MIEKYLEKLNTKGEMYLRIKARPNSASTKITEIQADETIKIDLAAQAEKDKANIELRKYLAKIFKTRAKNVTIISGRTERLKLIKIIKSYEN